jgi:signal transduction histidine kinase
MTLKNVLHELNIVSKCKDYGLSLWQCPQFLFLVMGAVIGFASITSFVIGTRYITNPAIVVLIVLFIAAVLFVISYLVIRSFERLAEANRMKSEFISVVSHQLRSPLSNLKWALELLMSGRLGKIEEKQTEYFKILKENTARMKELVSDLIIVSRIETATLPSKKELFSFPDLVRKAVVEFRAFAAASNVELKLDIKENLPSAFADPDQIRQVLQNLLDNAIRYIRSGGEVKIKVQKKGEELFFEIKDTGVGIPERDRKHIFQKFFRSSNILRHQTQGSGLGLFIAKSIIKKAGGEMGFKSQEKKGTIFWFTLPTK